MLFFLFLFSIRHLTVKLSFIYSSQAQALNLATTGEESKLNYLKNLMVNYFTADPSVRDHMEGAIGTVLQFTPEYINKIQKKKAEDSWF